uniref:Uncharacterized protein n=1 Tax=Rhizophora mucronata TaxID=61149 RepID=A0A2P2QTR3_RHIMU
MYFKKHNSRDIVKTTMINFTWSYPINHRKKRNFYKKQQISVN